jgi:hypothetical protein
MGIALLRDQFWTVSAQIERAPASPNLLPAMRRRRIAAAMTRLIALPTCCNDVIPQVLPTFAARDEVLCSAEKLLCLARREVPLPTELGWISFEHWKLAVVTTAGLLLERKGSQTRKGFTHRCLRY